MDILISFGHLLHLTMGVISFYLFYIMTKKTLNKLKLRVYVTTPSIWFRKITNTIIRILERFVK